MELYKLAKLNDFDGNLSKQWYVFYSYRHPETKKFEFFKKYISLRYKTKSLRYEKSKEIIHYINNWLKNGGNPYLQSAQFMKMIDAIDFVLKIKKASLRPRSWSSYQTVINKFKLWLNKYHPTVILEEFSFYHAQRFMDHISISEKLQNRSYNNHVTYMRIFFNCLIDREYIAINPFKKVKVYPKTEAVVRNFSPEEMQIIREKMPYDNKWLWLASQFIYYCFIRPSELSRLLISDIDFVRKEIYVRPEVSKNRKGATLPIPEPLMEQLLLYKIYAFPMNYYIFSSSLHPGKKPGEHNSLSRHWRKWAKENLIFKNLYDFKHTGVGKALDIGININDLRMQLRHSSLTITQAYLERYRSQPGDKLRKEFPRF